MIRIAESDRRQVMLEVGVGDPLPTPCVCVCGCLRVCVCGQVMLEVAVGDPAERGYYEGVDNRLESAVAYFASIGFTEARER